MSIYLPLFVVRMLLVVAAIPHSILADYSSDPNVNDILSEMKAQKRYIFAAGFDGLKTFLFFSGSGNAIDFSNGYQIESPNQPTDGKFDQLKEVKKLSTYSNAKFSVDELLFTTKDSKGLELVSMNKKSVNVLNLDSGDLVPLKILGDSEITTCYHNGALHLSSSDSSTYYVIDSKGVLTKYTFNNAGSVALSTACQPNPLGLLCLRGNLITVSVSCTDLPPPNITSGLVTDGTVYLFNKAGDLTYFSSDIFKQPGSTEVNTVPSDFVWPIKTVTNSSAHPINPEASGSSGFLIGIIIGVILFFVVAFLCLCYLVNKARKRDKKGDVVPNSSISTLQKLEKSKRESPSMQAKVGAAETGAGAAGKGGGKDDQPNLSAGPHYHLNVVVRPGVNLNEQEEIQALGDATNVAAAAADQMVNLMEAQKGPDVPDVEETSNMSKSESDSNMGPPPPAQDILTSVGKQLKQLKKPKNESKKTKTKTKKRSSKSKSKKKKKNFKKSMKKSKSKLKQKGRNSEKTSNRKEVRKGSSKKSSVKKQQTASKKKTPGGGSSGKKTSSSRKGGSGKFKSRVVGGGATSRKQEKSAKRQNASSSASKK